MKTVNIASALPLLKILKIIGLWSWSEDGNPDQLNYCLQMVYRYLLQVPLSFVMIALMWVEVIKSEDLTQAGSVLYMSFTETAFLIKMFNIWLLSKKALVYINEIGSDDIYELRTHKECEYWQEEQKLFGRIAVGYIGGSVAVCVLAFVGVLLLPDYALPFELWAPFDWHNSRNYWMLYVYEIFAMHLTCVSNTTLDMIQCYFLFHLAMLYKLIGMRLKRLEYLKEKEVLIELREIFKFHSNVKRLTIQCEELISAPILTQIILSALVLCFTGYRLQKLNFIQDTGRFLAMLQYLSVMSLQIFLPCYYGNEITVNANDLTLCAYSTKWYQFSVPTRKIIFLYMEFLKKPVKIKAGGFFEVGLPIFSKTMNNAYSFFAILLNMDK